MNRTDRGGLASPISANIYEGVAARLHAPGDPLRYEHGDEYRDADELQRIVDQLPGKPIKIQHDGPPVGVVLSSRLQGGSQAIAQFVLTDPAAIAAVRSGSRIELSLGYKATRDSAGYQRGIEVEELSVLPQGGARCGRQCFVKTDATEADAARDLRRSISMAWTEDAGDCGCGCSATTTDTFTDEASSAAALRERLSNAWR